MGRMRQLLRVLAGSALVQVRLAGHRIELSDGDAHRSMLTLLVETGITSIRTSRPSLEEVYVHLIGDRGLKV